MNIKTTLLLGLAAAAVAIGYMAWQRSQTAPASNEQTASSQEGPGRPAAGPEGQFLFQPPFEEDTRIVHVAYRKRGKAEVVFKRDEDDDSPQGKWTMVEPAQCRATAWTRCKALPHPSRCPSRSESPCDSSVWPSRLHK